MTFYVLGLPQEQCGSYTFIPYIVSPQGKVFACDASIMTGIQELMRPTFQLETLLTPLVERLVHLLNNVQVQSRSATAPFTVHSKKNLTSTYCKSEQAESLEIYNHLLCLSLQRVLPGVDQA